MAEQPPTQLVAMLERLGLATAAEVARCGGRVRRLSRDLPQFESVWVDALAQARVLTPYQAAEINAGRGDSLRVGPYLLCERLAEPCYTACYRARHIESKENVRLAVAETLDTQVDSMLRALETLVQRGNRTGESPSPAVARGLQEQSSQQQLFDGPRNTRPSDMVPITNTGSDGQRVFAASAWVEGRTAAEWMVHHGRFSAEVVLEIARSMLSSLAELERARVGHGDVSISSLVLSDNGRVVLLLPGLRGILRPEEGYAHDDLRPEAYDSLAPERVAFGTPPDTAADLYACGCVWWHLLCGRPPLAGGNGLSKLRAAQAAAICDVRRFAPEVPASLAGAMAACLQRDPGQRPMSFAHLASALGSPTRTGQEALADCLARTGRPRVPWTTTARSIRKSNRTPLWLAGAACALASLVAVAWPLLHSAPTQNNSQTPNHGRNGIIAKQGRGTLDIGKQEIASRRNADTISKTPQQPLRTAATSPEPPLSLNRGTSQERSDEPYATNAAHAAGIPIEAPPVSESRRVVAASYQPPATPKDLVLSADGSITAESLAFQTGQRVRGPSGQRGVLRIPKNGLVVNREGVRFENIDFVWNDDPAGDPRGNAKGFQNEYFALVHLNAGRAEFHGCSFHAVEKSVAKPVAIGWLHPAEAVGAAMSLPSGRIRLSNCTFAGVAAGVDCHTIGTLGIEVVNTLYRGQGPLLRLDHWPSADEAVSLTLLQTTTRQSGPLLECLLSDRNAQSEKAQSGEIGAQFGEIAVQSAACVFSPASGMPLMRVCGPELPDQLMANIHWTGHGSLVPPDITICDWQPSAARQQPVDEASLAIAGLVRSDIGFAGATSDDPAANRTIRWQAPLQSSEPPGVDPSPLPSTRMGGI